MGYVTHPNNAPGGEERDANDDARLRQGRDRVQGFAVGRYLQPAPMLFTRDGHNVFLGDLYRGQAAFLLCGGPSLVSHDLDKLNQRGLLTYALNNAATIFRPHLWSYVDDPGHFADAIWRDPGILKLVPLSHMEKTFLVRDTQEKLAPSGERVGDMPAVLGFRRNEAFVAEQWLYEDSFNWGNHSKLVDSQGNKGSRSVMYVALRMLFYLGVRRVYLLGCDFRMAVGQPNYAFEQDRTASSVRGNNGSYQVLNARLRELLPYFEREGFEVFNCTPNSGLTVFPHCEFDEAVKQAVERSGVPERIVTRGMYDGADKVAGSLREANAGKKNGRGGAGARERGGGGAGRGLGDLETRRVGEGPEMKVENGAATAHGVCLLLSAQPVRRGLARTPLLTWKTLGARRRSAGTIEPARQLPSAGASLPSYYRDEDQRYSELYQRGYGVGPVKSLLRWALAQGVTFQGKSVVDCGCGRASLVDAVAGFTRYVGVDLARFQIDANQARHRGRADIEFLHGSLDRLPMAGRAFDVSWCCDVLEHIPESLIGACIHEILRVAETAVLSISTRPSKILDANGNNLHLTVRPAAWWQARVAEHGMITHERAGQSNVSLIVLPTLLTPRPGFRAIRS